MITVCIAKTEATASDRSLNVMVLGVGSMQKKTSIVKIVDCKPERINTIEIPFKLHFSQRNNFKAFKESRFEPFFYVKE